MPDRVDIRLLAARDSMTVLTALLHRAYAPLAQQGLNFAAASQSVETTQQRAAEGQCFVAEQRGRIVGTVTVCGPYDLAAAPWAAGVAAFRDRDTAHFHQFAVDPGQQRQGIGRRLVAACERWARERGYKRMALDTAESATELRGLYERLGYVQVAQVQWQGRSYRSVVMERALDHSPLRDQLRLLARYHLWATRELLRHVDVLPEADYRRHAGLFFQSVHGTLNHLLLAEHEIWYRRFAEGASPAIALNQEIEPDRRALHERLVEAALAWLPLLEVWPESRLLGALAYRRLNGEPTTLPFAATLMHVFNHGTHHRGQITAALTAMGHACPELDMVRMLQQEHKAS
jgi:uncharacterized damage-inducible protein DinB/GNAT superfamily N-acetyltransferase